MRFSRLNRPCVHVFAKFRPETPLPYEHMFWLSRTKAAQRLLDAMRTIRSFLLLEDDYSVGWEVDEGELRTHPHREPLRSRRPARRPGIPAPARHVCLSPVERGGTLKARASAPRAKASGGLVGGAGAIAAARLADRAP
jgi:hypothetical protein